MWGNTDVERAVPLLKGKDLPGGPVDVAWLQHAQAEMLRPATKLPTGKCGARQEGRQVFDHLYLGARTTDPRLGNAETETRVVDRSAISNT